MTDFDVFPEVPKSEHENLKSWLTSQIFYDSESGVGPINFILQIFTPDP